MVILIILLLFFITGCSRFNIVMSPTLYEVDDVILNVTTKWATKDGFIVKGTAINIGDETIPDPWYVETMFYSDSTLTIPLGGSQEMMNFSLEPDVESQWTLTYDNHYINESDYPHFELFNIKTFIQLED